MAIKRLAKNALHCTSMICWLTVVAKATVGVLGPELHYNNPLPNQRQSSLRAHAPLALAYMKIKYNIPSEYNTCSISSEVRS